MTMVDRRLLLLRHGKALRESPDGTDRARPLAERGVADAEAMGDLVGRAAVDIDLVVSSPAVRAHQTAEAFVAGYTRRTGTSPGTTVEPRLYGTGPGTVLDVVRELADDLRTVLLVGHEPTWSQMAGRLIGGGAVAMPTAALAAIDLAEAWARTGWGHGALSFHLVPRIARAAAGRPEPA